MRELNLQEFVDEIYADYKQNDDSKYVFFLGAGCSRSSGIPLASELSEIWYKELEKQTSKFNRFNKIKKINNKNKINYSKFYFEIFEELFPTPLSQQKEIQRLTEDKMPSSGYYSLVSLMQKTSFNTVITTNFDNLIQDALKYSCKKRALVINHQDLAKFIERNNTPLITKIHGDSHMHPFNNKKETIEIPSELKDAIQGLFTNAKVIFIGYSGNDKSIANLLESCKRIDQVYWFGTNQPTTTEIGTWWENTTCKTFVKERDFDIIMNLIKSKFDLDEPDFDTRAKKLKTSYGNYIDKEINELKEINKKTDINYMLLGNNYSKNKEYNKAIESYEKAIKINPEYSSAFNNLGNVYSDNKEYNKAIESYEKAIKINPEDSNAYINLFELELIVGKSKNQKLHKNYISHIRKSNESLFQYDMLNILRNIAEDKNVDIKKLLIKYNNETLEDWCFENLDSWKLKQKETVKNKLNLAINELKLKLKKTNN